MSHFEVAEELRRCLDFSPNLSSDVEVHMGIGESFFRIGGQDGRTYGVLVKRLDDAAIDITGEIVRLAVPEDDGH